MTAIVDTAFIEFSLVDGDGDIGNDTNSAIYIKDSRFDSAGYFKNFFPAIDASVEDPTKGLQGTCVFFPLPQPTPRLDSAHLKRDTLFYEFYITDRAGNTSNHLITHSLVVKAK